MKARIKDTRLAVAFCLALVLAASVAAGCVSSNGAVTTSPQISAEPTQTAVLGNGGTLESEDEVQIGTLIITDTAGAQVSDCPTTQSASAHSFGGVFYLPCEMCEVYITAGGATYCSDYGGCVQGITDIWIDGTLHFGMDDTLHEALSTDCFQNGASRLTVKTNLGGGFHYIGAYHFYELAYRYLSVSYSCGPQEHESTE